MTDTSPTAHEIAETILDIVNAFIPTRGVHDAMTDAVVELLERYRGAGVAAKDAEIARLSLVKNEIKASRDAAWKAAEAAEARIKELRAKIGWLRAAIEDHQTAMDHHGGDIDFALWGSLAEENRP